jgi:hypothetical protein
VSGDPRIRRFFRRREALCALLWLVLSSTWAAAIEPQTDEKAPSMLVLKNGRIVKGTIGRGAGGYTVERPSGSMLIPFEQVRLEADDLRTLSHAQHLASFRSD